MARRRHPVYTAFMIFLILMCLLGLVLLVWGGMQHQALPHPMMIAPKVRHG